MKLEELKKQLSVWKRYNAGFYNDYVHAIRDGKATLSAYMHIYDYAMNQISDLPKSGATDKPCGEAVQMLTQNCRQTIHDSQKSSTFAL